MRMIHSAYNLEFTETCGGGGHSSSSSSTNSSIKNNEQTQK